MFLNQYSSVLMIWQYPVSVKSRLKIFVVPYTKMRQGDAKELSTMAAKSETGLGGEEGFDEFSGKRRQEIGLCTFEAFTYKEWR